MNDILHFCLGHGGAVLFLIVLLEQVGAPVPAVPLLLASGALCATGEANPGMIVGVTVLACLVADSGWFYLGRRSGKRVLRLIARHLLPGNDWPERLEHNFAHHGTQWIVLSKFVPGVSLLVPPLSGAAEYRFGRFLLFDLLGSSLYAWVYVLLGSIFSQQVQSVLETLHRFGLWTLLFLIGLAATWIAVKWHSLRKRGLTHAAAEGPIGQNP